MVRCLTEKDFDILGLTLGDRRALQDRFVNRETKTDTLRRFTKKNTLKLQLGWRHAKTGNDFRQVKRPQGGGTMIKDFERLATCDEVLNVCKELFFPAGKSERKGTVRNVDIFLANHRGENVAMIDGEPFTVEKYRHHASVSKGNTARIYLMTSEKQKSESKIPFEDHLTLHLHRPDGPQHEVDVRSIQNATLAVKSNADRRALIEQQDLEYCKKSKEGQQKQQQQQQQLENLEQLRREREARVPQEPDIEEDYIGVLVNHVDRGFFSRRFSPSSIMQVVYDWIGSLQADPPHFALYIRTYRSTQDKIVVYPTKRIIRKRLLYMEYTQVFQGSA